ncbi:hypothetical protein ABW19_dt0207584 [Dactylella cylindrospora]|nr:hypothetical protein ABW19_dt0207584 [Dactylella cylindrospora]
MTSTPTISINSPPTSSRPSIDSSNALSRLSSESLQSLASLPSQAGTPSGSSGFGSRQNTSSQRRNRSALREFYGLKRRDEEQQIHSSVTSAPTFGVGLGVDIAESSDGLVGFSAAELDASSFDAQTYVEKLAGGHNLKGLLRVENGLVNDIRGLDGERKSLVYDNYNKLIAATDTIRSMRSNMEPLNPATTTLSPAISHIASVSATLVQNVHAHDPNATAEAASKLALRRKQEAVQQILRTPDRMQDLLRQGKRDEASKEWETAKRHVARWKNLRNFDVDEFLRKGEEILSNK